jgi:hypothetical protein
MIYSLEKENDRVKRKVSRMLPRMLFPSEKIGKGKLLS